MNKTPILNETENEIGLKSTKKVLKSNIIWILSFLSAATLFVIFLLSPMIPFKWSMYLLIALSAILAITGFLSFRRPKSNFIKYNLIMKIINCIITAIFCLSSILLPYYEARVTAIVDNNNVITNKVKMNFYVLTNEYKSKHPEIFGVVENADDSSNELSESDFINQYGSSVFITSFDSDLSHQQEAVNDLDEILGTSSKLLDKKSIYEAADSLYKNEGQLLIMNESYSSVLSDSDNYADFLDNTKIVYSIYVNTDSEKAEIEDVSLTTEPFSVFFGGNDEEGELSLTGRTDVDMIVTVNPTSHQISITSFPRDSYVGNPALNNQPDKLTHLGMSGISNTLKGLSNILDTSINNYVLINFSTYREIINALGGVDVVNPYTFEADDEETFKEGTIHLEGDSALMYVRERHHLPDGDFGRNMHQQLVMQAIIKKLSSPEVIVRFNSLLSALNGTFLTNLSSNSIYSFCQMQLQENIEWNVVTYRAMGGTGNAVCASAPSQELSCVFPYANQVQFMANVIDEIEAGNTVTQQDMPDGEGYYIDPINLNTQAVTNSQKTTTVTSSTPAPTAVATATATTVPSVPESSTPVATAAAKE